MPVYRINCSKCGLTKEIHFKSYDWEKEIDRCECGNKDLKKLPSIGNFVLVGPNWASKKGI